MTRSLRRIVADLEVRAPQSQTPVADLAYVSPPARKHDAKSCRACGSRNTSCLDSRPVAWLVGQTTRRRYGCADCNARWTTYEVRDSELEALQQQANASDKAASIRTLAALIVGLGLNPEDIVSAMVEARK